MGNHTMRSPNPCMACLAGKLSQLLIALHSMAGSILASINSKDRRGRMLVVLGYACIGVRCREGPAEPRAWFTQQRWHLPCERRFSVYSDMHSTFMYPLEQVAHACFPWKQEHLLFFATSVVASHHIAKDVLWVDPRIRSICTELRTGRVRVRATLTVSSDIQAAF